MPNINDSFPSKYLKASDLRGNAVVVTMDRVEFEKVGSDRKAILYFQGNDKGLVLNKTNANKITEITGSALTEEWPGHQVRLYPTETQFQGDMVDCIRVKPVQGQRMQMTKTPPPPAEEHRNHVDDDDDSIPF